MSTMSRCGARILSPLRSTQIRPVAEAHNRVGFLFVPRSGIYQKALFLVLCECSIRPHRLTVRTPAFQAVNPGSIPGGVTNWDFDLSHSSESLKASDNFGVPLSIS